MGYVLYPYFDETRYIQSNIALCLREFPRAKPKRTPEGRGLYLTIYCELSPNTDSISFMLMIPSLISLTISRFNPKGVYCELYPLLESNTVVIAYFDKWVKSKS